jgi:hypothetical protein
MMGRIALGVIMRLLLLLLLRRIARWVVRGIAA